MDKTNNGIAHTRDRILKVARELFLTHGYHKTSMRMIAKEAGISTGPLYFHFEKKADVFAAICMEGLDKLNSRILNTAQSEGPVFAKLGAIMELLKKFVADEPEYQEIMRLAFNKYSGLDFTKEQEQMLLDKKFVTQNVMQEIIAEGVQKGELRHMEPKLLMLFLYSMGEGIIVANETGVFDYFNVDVEQMLAVANDIAAFGMFPRQ